MELGRRGGDTRWQQSRIPKERDMKSALLVITLAALTSAAALVLAPAGSSSPAANDASQAFQLLPPAAPAGQMTLFGHIKTLSRKGGRFLMGFDPAWFTSGLTASRAKF